MRSTYLAAVFIAGTFCASADGLREGKWEYTAKMKIAGMPEMPEMPQMPEGVQLPPGVKMPTFSRDGIVSTFQQCITKDNLVPTDGKEQKDCKVTSTQRTGDTVTWKMRCESPDQKLDGEGTATYTGSTMTSRSHIKGTMSGEPVDMAQEMTGRYLGPC